MEPQDLKRRIDPPAIAMLATSALVALLGAAGIAISLISPGSIEEVKRPWPGSGEVDLDPAVVRAIELGSGATTVLMASVAAFGAFQLLRRGRHAWGFGLAAAILLCTPCLWPCCCPVSAGIGIWAIVVLLADDVRRALSGEPSVPPAFEVAPPPRPEDPDRDGDWSGGS